MTKYSYDRRASTRFELVYQSGGTGGPYDSEDKAKAAAERLLKGGSDRWIAVIDARHVTDLVKAKALWLLKRGGDWEKGPQPLPNVRPMDHFKEAKNSFTNKILDLREATDVTEGAYDSSRVFNAVVGSMGDRAASGIKLDNKYARHMPARVEAEIAKDPESDYSTAVYRIVPPGVVKVTFSDPPGTERKWVQDPEYWYRGWALTFDKNQGSVGGAWLAGGSTYGRAKFTANRHQGLRHLIKLIDAEYPGQSKILS